MNSPPQEESATPAFWRSKVLPFLVACIGVSLSYLCYSTLRDSEAHRAESEFIRRCTNITDTLQNGIEKYVRSVQAVSFLRMSSGLFGQEYESRVDIRVDIPVETGHEWDLLLEMFKVQVSHSRAQFPGIRAQGWIAYVTPEVRAEHEAGARMLVDPDYSIKELVPDGSTFRAALPKAEYFPIFRIEPLEEFDWGIGWDLGISNACRNALLESRDSGRTTATHSIELLQELNDGRATFAMFDPIYTTSEPLLTVEDRRKNFHSWSMSVVVIVDMVNTSLESLDSGEIDFAIFSKLDEPTRDRIYSEALYSTIGKTSIEHIFRVPPERSDLSYTTKLGVVGREWLLDFSPKPGFSEAYRSLGPFLVLIGGLACTVLLATYLWRSAARETRVQTLVAKRTGELSRSNRDLAHEATKRAESEKVRKSLEERLRHSEKMESVGTLAGGIAHDFNNLLTAMLGHAELLQGRVGDAPGASTDIETILDAGHRAASLTNQLLAFSRTQVLDPQSLNLNSVCERSVKMIRRVIGENINIELALCENLDSIFADPSQLEQVVINLAINARDAMPNGGELRIETANVELSPESVTANVGLESGPHVILSVTDNGAGMDEATLEKIFDPFFTTKSLGNGTGLGLASVYGTVKQSRGSISVDSSLGVGTTFNLYFPRRDSIESDEIVERESTRAPGGTERILLVEDEANVRNLTCRMLRENGYTVSAAETGEEALDFMSREGRDIDLLITDVMLPGISGRDLAHRVEALGGRTIVLFVSGYSYDFLSDRRMLDKDLTFLRKPFALNDLLCAVRDALDGVGA